MSVSLDVRVTKHLPAGGRRFLESVAFAGSLACCVSWSDSTSAESPARTDTPTETPSETSKEITTGGFRPPLEPLPELPSRQWSEPSADDLAVVSALLDRLTSASELERQTAVSDLTSISASLAPAVYESINRTAREANRGAMKQLLLDVRRRVRERLAREQGGGEVVTPDYLQMVVGEPNTSSEDWKRLVRALALSRMSVAMGDVSAVRALIHVYVRFEFLRIDTQVQLQKLGELALPALLETTRHPAPQVAEWAKQQLDYLGKAIPSEAVRVASPEVLADVLRAYGYIKDPDAARLVLSFASSERAQVRQAARQAIQSYGASSIWVLRDGYEQTLGVKPSSQWGWDRIARELFREYDRNRLSEVYAYYERGLARQADGKLEDALVEFEGLLRRSPDFEPHDKIVAAILEFAKLDPEGNKDWDRVERLLQSALRLGDSEQRKQARSLLATVQSRRLAARGVADQFLLRGALELDQQNTQAELLLGELEKPVSTGHVEGRRWLWSATLGALSLLFVALLVRSRHNTSRPEGSPNQR